VPGGLGGGHRGVGGGVPVMRWRVEISERSGEGRLLRDVLEALSIRLHEQAGHLFLIGDPFEALETAGEVHALASRIQSRITEVGKDNFDIPMSFQIGHVLEELENGEQRRHLFMSALGSAVCFATVGGVSLVVNRGLFLSEAERTRIEEIEKEAAYQKKRRKATACVVSAFRDHRALEVQRLLVGDLNPQTMGHIADLIQDDIGGAMKDLVPRNQLKRFYRSINHPEVFGKDARHIVSDDEPPPNPMRLDEARKFIHTLASLYLEKKAGLPPLGGAMVGRK
jgi:hypothetical protein